MLILHLDIDAFFASVEQVLDPRLAGRPVVVGAGVIASCSYEARRSGLHAGMPIREARRLCPSAAFLDGRTAVYRAFAERAFDVLRERFPAVETHLDEAFCDLTGAELCLGLADAAPAAPSLLPLFSPEADARPRVASGLRSSPLRAPPAPAPRERLESLGRAVRDEVLARTGLSSSVGIGPSRMAAKVACKGVKPGGVAAIRTEDDLARLIGPMPVRVVPGVGFRTEAVLAGLNVRTVEELRRLPEPALAALFGANGRAIFDRARGRDLRAPPDPAPAPRSLSRETTLHRDSADRAEVEGMLQYLCGRAARAARRQGLAARTVAVKIAYADFRREAASRALEPPSDLDADVFGAALRLLGSLWSRRAALRAVGVSLSGFVAAPRFLQRGLFDPGPDPARRHRLARALDRVRDRFGHSAVVDGRSLRLLGALEQDGDGFVLRTPCLTR